MQKIFKICLIIQKVFPTFFFLKFKLVQLHNRIQKLMQLFEIIRQSNRNVIFIANVFVYTLMSIYSFTPLLKYISFILFELIKENIQHTNWNNFELVRFCRTCRSVSGVSLGKYGFVAFCLSLSYSIFFLTNLDSYAKRYLYLKSATTLRRLCRHPLEASKVSLNSEDFILIIT